MQKCKNTFGDSYAPPIISAANTYLSEKGSGLQAYNATGSSRDKIMDYLEKGIPVVTWVTLDLSSPKVNSHWYLQDSGEYYAATTNLHVMVLNGVIGDMVHVMNPLVGQVTYNADTFLIAMHRWENMRLWCINIIYHSRTLLVRDFFFMLNLSSGFSLSL